MCDPANSTRQGKDHGEHGSRDTHGLEDNAGVKVDVREQLSFDEVGIAECDFFQLHSQLKLWVVDTQLVQYFVAGLTHNRGARSEERRVGKECRCRRAAWH